eukprot:COSAG02_NODE_51753_length_312_cov_0.723005_1_plen_58_part_10
MGKMIPAPAHGETGIDENSQPPGIPITPGVVLNTRPSGVASSRMAAEPAATATLETLS